MFFFIYRDTQTHSWTDGQADNTEIIAFQLFPYDYDHMNCTIFLIQNSIVTQSKNNQI